MIEHSLQEWATSAGWERRTLEARFVKAGLTVPKRDAEKIPFKHIVIAILGDKEAEVVRALKLDNEKRERDAKQESGELFPMAELEPWLVQNYVLPMANIMATAPTSLDTRCNPENPALARSVLKDFFENTVKPALKAGLEKPQK